MSLRRMRRISSEPSINGRMDRIITRSGFCCVQVAIVWSGEEQHMTFVLSSPIISAMSVAVALRREYITIFGLFIGVNLPL